MTGLPYSGFASLFGVGKIALVSDTSGTQTHQLLLNALELPDNVPVMSNFGFSSVPKPGADAVVIFVRGDRSRGVVIGTNDPRYKPRGLLPGQSVQYHASGTTITCTSDGNVTIRTSGGGGAHGTVTVDGKLVVNGDVSIVGDTSVTGNAIVTKYVVAQDCVANAAGPTSVSLFNHEHGNGNGGADTTPPIAI